MENPDRPNFLNAESAENLAKAAEKCFAVFANYLALFAVYFFR